MKFRLCIESLRRAWVWRLTGVVALCSCALVAAPREEPAGRRADDDIFHSTTLLRISIDIPEEGMQVLRRSRPTRSPQPKPRAQARVTEGDCVYTNVTVQLKGFTSFRRVDELPSLTLNFARLAPKQRFHGLSKLSLNNSLQDPTRLHEKLARELFAEAGVPVPRADHALVTLNGRGLGLYVLTEGFDKTFLRQHFTRTDGNLYEGGTLQDIDRPLRVTSGKNPTNDAGVRRLLRAAGEPDPDRRFQALQAALDLDRFVSMVAMETILCHSDSYSMNRNNYRLYQDPVTDKIVFMPHGMDRVLGTHRSTLDLPVVPPLLGLVARALLSTPKGRRRHVERVAFLFTNLFQPDRLCRRVHEIEAKIAAEKLSRPASHGFGIRLANGAGQDAEDLCRRISERAAELQMQLAHFPTLLDPQPILRFDADGIARLEGWKPKRRPGALEVSCETSVRDGMEVLHLRVPEGPLSVSLGSRVSLPAGRYRVIGQILLTDAFGPTRPLSGAILRNSTTRFGVARQRLDWTNLNFPLEVSAENAPEEIQFICEVRDDSCEVWFDTGAIRLKQERE